MPRGRRGNPLIGTYDNAAKAGKLNCALAGAYYNDGDPFKIRKRERPWYRIAAQLQMEGAPVAAIAAAVNKNPNTVVQTLRQPFMREFQINETKKLGVDAIRERLEAEGPSALARIIEMGKNAESENVRLAANQYTIDRIMGRPNQPMTIADQRPASELNDDELEQRIRNRLTKPSSGAAASEAISPVAATTSAPESVNGRNGHDNGEYL